MKYLKHVINDGGISTFPFTFSLQLLFCFDLASVECAQNDCETENSFVLIWCPGDKYPKINSKTFLTGFVLACKKQRWQEKKSR